jgi:hypothetical protein
MQADSWSSCFTLPISITIMSRGGVTIKTGSGLDDWVYCNVFTQLGITGNTALPLFPHTLQFTVTHALRFSALTSRILATGLSHSHCNFKSHVKVSCYSLDLFLPFLLSHLRLPSPVHPPTVLCSVYCLPSSVSSNTPRHVPHTKHRLLLSGLRVYWSIYLAVDVLLLSAYASREYVYRLVT